MANKKGRPMKKLMLALAMSCGLGGCGGLRMPPLASCDGAERRPLNAGLWKSPDRADLIATSSKC
jgi:hypothetical protein